VALASDYADCGGASLLHWPDHRAGLCGAAGDLMHDLSAVAPPSPTDEAIARTIAAGCVAGCRIALLVAHHGDEIIGVGAQLPRWASDLTCVYATDGSPAGGPEPRTAGFSDRHLYARARAEESRDALRIAGIAWSQVREFGFTDRSLVYRLEDLDRAVQRFVADLQPDIILTHAFEGGHPDHDALSLVARSVAHQSLHHGRAVAILEFAGYAKGPDGTLVTNRFVGPPDAPAHRLPVRAGDRRRKTLMVQSFRTPQLTLAPSDTGEEWLRAAPAYDYRQPPNGAGLVRPIRLGRHEHRVDPAGVRVS
jgi:N-acetylglucosamine malate deacetylase 2